MSVWVCFFVRYSPIFFPNSSGCVTAGENISINDLVVLGLPGFLFSPASSAGRVPAAHSSTPVAFGQPHRCAVGIPVLLGAQF